MSVLLTAPSLAAIIIVIRFGGSAEFLDEDSISIDRAGLIEEHVECCLAADEMEAEDIANSGWIIECQKFGAERPDHLCAGRFLLRNERQSEGLESAHFFCVSRLVGQWEDICDQVRLLLA